MPLKVLRMFWRNSHSRMLFLDETIRSLPNAYRENGFIRFYAKKQMWNRSTSNLFL